MNQNVAALSKALDVLRDKLVSTKSTSPGFREMRKLYRELTLALIDAGDQADAEIAKEIEAISNNIKEELETSKDKLQPWFDVLKPVVTAVGVVVKIGSLGNPLLALLP